MKKFIIIFTEDSDDTIHIKSTNEGFTFAELVTLLEMKKLDLLEQVREPAKFTRIVKDQGVECEINDVEE